MKMVLFLGMFLFAVGVALPFWYSGIDNIIAGAVLAVLGLSVVVLVSVNWKEAE